MPTKLQRFTIQLDDETAAKVKILADADGRSVANYLARLVATGMPSGAAVLSARPVEVKLPPAKAAARKTA